MKQKSTTNRIEIEGAGIGEISEEMISRRARQLAEADGREEANASDLEEARGDLAAGGEEDDAEQIAEEDRPGSGVPPMSTGTQAPRLEPEDEGTLAAEEVEEGISEADFDTRAKSRHRG
jgi:sRNA-binding protein